MFCSNCGKEISDGARFCGGCGAPVGVPSSVLQPSATQPATPPRQQSTVIRVLAIVAVVLSVAIIALLAVFAIKMQPRVESTSMEQSVQVEEPAVRDESSDSKVAKEDKDDSKPAEFAERAEPAKPTVEQQAADAYDAVLNNAGSCFAEAWFDQYPDSEFTYTLRNLSDDDLPELLLCAHYSNVGSHKSGGLRMIPFVFDAQSNTAVEATSDEFSLFAEPWSVMEYSADQHAFMVELRYVSNMNSEFYKEYVRDTSLVRDQISSEEAQGGETIDDWTSVGDHSLVDKLRGKAAGGGKDKEADTSQEQSADKTYPMQTASTFETEDFIVEVPDFLEGKFSVEKQEGAVTKWLFKTDVWKSDNLVYGGVLCVADSDIGSKHVSHFGCTSSGKYVYSDVGVQGREDIFYTSPNNGGGTLATVTLK
ncbi:MAG: zinc-ribbon domain-containing protein [Atopobiaceae bacterium]|nr:zinc-ribbon domain-containing protein [Atopobiaceae bacterium]